MREERRAGGERESRGGGRKEQESGREGARERPGEGEGEERHWVRDPLAGQRSHAAVHSSLSQVSLLNHTNLHHIRKLGM